MVVELVLLVHDDLVAVAREGGCGSEPIDSSANDGNEHGAILAERNEKGGPARARLSLWG
jgi:hypothetical protein